MLDRAALILRYKQPPFREEGEFELAGRSRR